MSRILCIGQAVQDFVFSVNAMPCIPGKYQATGFQSVGGGPAATAAVTISRLGGNAMVAARLGDDEAANSIIAELQSFGVNCDLIRRIADCHSSLSAVLVDEFGERTIVNYLDQSMAADPSWLPESLPEDVDAVLADTRWPAGALYGFKLAKLAGKPAILDADVPIPQESELVRHCSHVIFSAPGLAEYSQEADPVAALLDVSKKVGAWCCVTLGSDGVIFIHDGEVRVRESYRVDVRDTLGAGDVWHGAFALALTEKQTIEDAVKFASAAAAIKVRNGGGRSGTPSRTEVEEFLQSSQSEI